VESIGDALRRHLECEDGPALAQRAFAFSSICSVASKATTKAAFGASAAVTTPGPQATSIKRPLAALPSAEPKRALTSASTLKQDRSAIYPDADAELTLPNWLASCCRWRKVTLLVTGIVITAAKFLICLVLRAWPSEHGQQQCVATGDQFSMPRRTDLLADLSARSGAVVPRNQQQDLHQPVL
jgi:hypothetical protein